MHGFSTLSVSHSLLIQKLKESTEGASKIIATQSAAPAKWDARYSHNPPHTTDYYIKCCIGGVLSCGLTHFAVTPLDVAKCNMQVDPQKYKGLIGSIKTIMREEGSAALFKGWLPTLIGYSLQGCFKFGLYEVFKDLYSNMAGNYLPNYLYQK